MGEQRVFGGVDEVPTLDDDRPDVVGVVGIELELKVDEPIAIGSGADGLHRYFRRSGRNGLDHLSRAGGYLRHQIQPSWRYQSMVWRKPLSRGTFGRYSISFRARLLLHVQASQRSS